MNAEELLRKTPFFAGMPAADLAALAQLAETRELVGGDHVYTAGAEADAGFVVVHGTVEVRLAGHDRKAATLGSGQWFGFDAFFEEGKRGGSAQTTEMTRLLRIPYAGLRSLIANRPELALLLYRNAARLYAQWARAFAAELQRPYF
jgi:CRP-like cAMP-binding protein